MSSTAHLPRIARLVVAALALLGGLLVPATGRAVDYTWNKDAGGNWADPANWLPGGFPTTAADTARFGNIITAARTVTVGNDVTAGIVFDAVSANPAVAYTLSGGTLTLGSAAVAPTITLMGGNATAGNQTISAGLAIPDNQTFTITNDARPGSTTLTLSSTATLGGNNLRMTVGGGSNTLIAAQVGSSFLGVTKNGAGVLELSASNNYNGNTNVTAGTLLVTNPTSGSATGNTPVTIAAGATLAGGNATGTLGRITGNALVNGTISPGRTSTEAGRLAMGATTTIDGGTYAVKLAGLTDVDGNRSQLNVQNDLVFLNAAISITQVGFLPFVPNTAYEYLIGTWTGNLRVNGASVGTSGPVTGIALNPINFTAGDMFSLRADVATRSLYLSYSPVPEPVAALSVFMVGLAALAWTRRRAIHTAHGCESATTQLS